MATRGYVFGVAVATVLGLGALGTAQPAAAAPAFDTYRVQGGQIDNRVVLGGTVVPARQVTITAQMPGRVEYLAGVEGDGFQTGTVLVALDQDELLARRQAALAQMGNADAALRNADMQYTRELVNPYSSQQMPGMMMPFMWDSMFTRPFSSMMGVNNYGVDRTAQLYSRATGIDQARGAFTQAQSQLQEIDAKLNDTKGVAPFDGVITKKLVEIGDAVQPGTPLLRYADTRALQVQVEVPSRLMPGLRVGDQVPARLDVSETTTYARVAQIFPAADPHRHTVTVKLDLPTNAPAAPGMYTEVAIKDDSAGAQSLPLIPVSALVRRGSLPAVFVVNDQGKTELRLVRLGDQVGTGFVAVLSGVRDGEMVVRHPAPGMRSSSAED